MAEELKEEKLDRPSDKPRDVTAVRLKKRPIIADDEEDVTPVKKKPTEAPVIKKHRTIDEVMKKYKSADETAKKLEPVKKPKQDIIVKKEDSAPLPSTDSPIPLKRSVTPIDSQIKSEASRSDQADEKPQDAPRLSEEPKSKESVDTRRDDEQKKQMLLVKREKERKEREKKMLLQLEADDEKRRKRLDQQRQQEKERLEMEKQKELLEIKQEKERQLSEIEANKPGLLTTAEQDLPLLGKTIRSNDYVIDMQLALVLGLQNIYHSCELWNSFYLEFLTNIFFSDPELSKKLVTDQEKERLWNLFIPYLCRGLPRYEDVRNEDIVNERNKERKRFMSTNLFWLKVSVYQSGILNDY